MRAAAFLLVAVVVSAGCAQTASVVLGVPTSVRDSGLATPLVAGLEAELGVDVVAVTGGSGELIEKLRRGDIDVLIAHAPDAEVALVASGDARARAPVMWNRFLIVGPPEDPARVAEFANASAALASVQRHAALFVSRADGSGTHLKEQALWAGLGIRPRGSWYLESGAGQAASLRLADQRGAYTLTDEATWHNLQAQGRVADLRVFELADATLVNPYHALVGADAGGPARLVHSWLTTAPGHSTIDAYRAHGLRLFTAGGPR